MSEEMDENDITLTVIRTSDAKTLQIEIPLSTKLGELKEDLGMDDFFGPLSPDHQRLFFLGRELKSNRSLQKLGLHRFPKNRVLHLHVKKQQQQQQQQQLKKQSKSTTTCGNKRQQQQQRRNNNNADATTALRQTRSSAQHKVTVTQSSAGDVLEIHDDDDSDNDEIVIEDSPRDKRRRIS